MYKINKIKDDKKFKREFEGMGEGLVLLKVESMIRNTGYNYHLFYRNGKKPPLDIAINPQNHVVEYVSFFLQEKMVIVEKFMVICCPEIIIYWLIMKIT